MIKMKKVGFSLILTLLFSAVILFFSDNYAQASVITLPDEYYFVFNGQNKEAGTEYEMKNPEVLLSITAGTWEPATTVEWVSSEPGVVELQATTYPSNFVRCVRRGPGYSTITAVVTQGTNTYSISCLIKVNLEFDYQRTGTIIATTTNERIAVLNNITDTKQIYLKYVDYIPEEDPETVTGSAITLTAVTWESENEGVVTVSDTGVVTAVGAGSSLITITTNTMSSQDKYLQISMMVVVRPSFTLIYDDANSVHHVVYSDDDADLPVPAVGVPSNFVIVSNASYAQNLKWEVYDSSNGRKLNPGSSKLTYTVSEISGNVTFNNVKAGTYDIYAFANEDYNKNTNAPYAYMKIIVPIDIEDVNIIMGVGDTYSIMENSNIPDVNIFTYTYIEGNQNIAQINQQGIITAKRYGYVRLRLVYRTEMDLFDDEAIEEDYVDVEIDLIINVIDGISLSASNASIYTSGTLMLQAQVTDPTQPVVWSSSDPSIVSVDNGLVTGVKSGIAIITALQTVGGIVKKATCEITVEQSATEITIDPEEIVLPIGGFQTLHATVTPQLSGVTLTWRSSNEEIVTIVESSARTATIQGVSGGHAVISAINQDNVVVGYCHVSVRQTVTSIVLSETAVTLDMNARRLQLRATVYPENALNKQVTFTSTDLTRARVDANGLVTLLIPGTVTIIATSEDNPAVTAMCNITIQVQVVSVALDIKEKTMYVGQSERLSYIILPNNASTNSVTWTSTNNSVAAVDGTGKVSAKGVGTAVIVLETVEGRRSAYCTITVRKIATGVKLDETELDMKVGESYQLKAALTPKDSTDNGLVWESSNTKVATVDAEGKVTARETGSAIIMVRTEAGGMAYCKVAVSQPVEGLILNFTEKTIYVGDKFELKVSVSPSEASELSVTWKSSNPKVATITEKGEVEGLMGGTTLITCTTVGGGHTATCVITALELVTTIKLDRESIKIGVDRTMILMATVSTQTATNKNVTWKSSNTKVAMVSQKGKVTGVSYGATTVTATAQDGSEVEAICEVEVVRPVTRVTLDKTFLAMLVGDTKELKVTVEPKNATYMNVTWISSDDEVILVDEDGFVTALNPGTATITVEAQDSSGKKALCYVTVGSRIPATGITLMDKKLVMVPGEEKTVQIALNPVNSTDGFSWSTDNAAVAKVDQNTGKITARAIGTANVTVMTDSGKTATIEITVIGLNITELTLEQYSNYELYVEGATTAIRWDVGNPEVAVVRNGMITSRALGTTTITANVNGRKLTCKLTVVKIL